MIRSALGPAPAGRLLLIGSGTGAVPLALSSSFAEVLTSDYCGKVTDFATKLLASPTGAYTSPLTGQTAVVPADAAASRVICKQLTWLPQEIGAWNAVVFNRFLERTLNAESWFPRMREVAAKDAPIVVLDKLWTAAALQASPHWGNE